jgi:hypothetical protein
MKNECLDVALQELESAGVRDVEHANGGRHVQVRWRVNGGEQRVYTIPATPSDWRASHNARAGIRRILREDGVIVDKPKPAEPAAPKPPDRLTLIEHRLAAIEQALFKKNGNGRAGDSDIA